MEFGIEIRGDKRAATRLYKMGQKAVHAEPILQRMGEEILQLEKERFAKGRFKPLAASTKARKRRQGLPRRPLKGATGDLETSLTSRGGKNIFNVDSTQLTVGSRVRYSFYHQYGIGVPKREPLKVTPKQRKPLANLLLRYLKGED